MFRSQKTTHFLSPLQPDGAASSSCRSGAGRMKAAVTERPGAMLKGAPPPPPAKGAPSGKGVAAGAVAPAAAPPSKISTFRQGDRCAVKSDTVSGTGVIQFVGEVASLGPGHWVGVLHDEPVGTSNGVIDGRRLFACPNKHGGFYAVHEIRVDKHADEKASGGVPKASGGVPQPSSASPSGVVGDEAGPSVPCAATSVAAGRGLHTAVVAQLSQITITCNDAYGRRTSGGDSLSVIVRGVSPPTQLRVKLHDHGKGVYVAEYRAELSGQLLIAVCIRGEAVPGSPFSVEALALHAEASQCKLRGNALVAAVARKPMAFEIDFVDALGNPAAAEELDVRLERAEPLPPEAAPVGIDGDEGQDAEALAEEKAAFEERLAAVGTLRVLLSKASGLDAADMNGKSDPYVVLLCAAHKAKSTIKPKTLSPVWNEEFSFAGTLQSIITSGLMVKVYDCDNPLKPEKDDILGEKLVSLDCLKYQNTSEFVEFLAGTEKDPKALPKGKVMLTVTWQPPPGAEDEDTSVKLLVGDERVRGSRPLIASDEH